MLINDQKLMEAFFKPPFVPSFAYAQMNIMVVLLWLYVVLIYTVKCDFSPL